MSRTRTIQIAVLGSILTLRCWSQPVKPGPQPEDPAVSLESLLQTRVVTARHFSEDLKETPGVMTVLQRSDLQRWGGLTLREILNRVSGLSIVSNTFSDRSIVSVRGEQSKDSGSRVLFLINGRPTREVLEGGVMTELLESFPVSILEWIEVIEGHGSVLYGSNAYLGVINLITRRREGRSQGLTASANPHVGPRQQLAANVRLELEKYLGPGAKRAAFFAHEAVIDRPAPLKRQSPRRGVAPRRQPHRAINQIVVEFSFKRE